MVQDLTTTQIYNIDASYRPVMEENNTKLMENDLIVYYKKNKNKVVLQTQWCLICFTKIHLGQTNTCFMQSISCLLNDYLAVQRNRTLITMLWPYLAGIFQSVKWKHSSARFHNVIFTNTPILFINRIEHKWFCQLKCRQGIIFFSSGEEYFWISQ